MTKSEKVKFVTDILESVSTEIIGKINSGAIPEGWTGHELRCWMSDKFSDDIRMLRQMGPTRYREYKNDVLVHNL